MKHDDEKLAELHAALGLVGFEHFIQRRTTVDEYRRAVELQLIRFGLLDAP